MERGHGHPYWSGALENFLFEYIFEDSVRRRMKQRDLASLMDAILEERPPNCYFQFSSLIDQVIQDEIKMVLQ